MTIKINRVVLILCGILLTLFAAGCVDTDETRSFYILPDGRVDLVIFQDNIYSSDKEKGPKELKEWFRNFKARKSTEVKKLKETGAHRIQSSLVKKDIPYAAVIRASYDSVEEFGRLFDLNRPGGEGTITFEQEGKTRRLIFRAKDKTKRITRKVSPLDPRLYYPLWKFITVGGKITKADGFVISEDRRSCLLNLPGLERMMKTAEEYHFFIEWNLE